MSYDTELKLEAHSCQDRIDPRAWGENAGQLWEPFDGAHFGYGLGPMTDALRGSWSADTIARLGPAMVASWVAINDLDGNWTASDWTTSILFEVDGSGALVTEPGPDGEDLLVAVDVSALAPGDPLPTAYVRSYPSWVPGLPAHRLRRALIGRRLAVPAGLR